MYEIIHYKLEVWTLKHLGIEHVIELRYGKYRIQCSEAWLLGAKSQDISTTTDALIFDHSFNRTIGKYNTKSAKYSFM